MRSTAADILRRQLLPLSLGHEFPALGLLLVPHGADGLGLQPAQAALGGDSPSNLHRPVRMAVGEVAPEIGLVAGAPPLASINVLVS